MRESEVYALLKQALSRKEIAKLLKINVLTVRSHITQIYEKYGVHSTGELFASRDNIIPTYLTIRQQQLLVGLLAGLPMKLIARHIGITRSTAAKHATLLYAALDVDGREQVAALYS